MLFTFWCSLHCLSVAQWTIHALRACAGAAGSIRAELQAQREERRLKEEELAAQTFEEYCQLSRLDIDRQKVQLIRWRPLCACVYPCSVQNGQEACEGGELALLTAAVLMMSLGNVKHLGGRPQAVPQASRGRRC